MEKDQHTTSGGELRKRKRGTGSANVIRNGFYASHFNELELDDLAAITGSLDDEIAHLRIVNRRMFEFANKNEPATLQEWTTYLSAVGAANTRIANLIKLRSLMEVSENDEQNSISKVLSEVVRELGIK